MAFKYTLVASMDLRASISIADAAALEYLVCGIGALPATPPAHPFFELPESRSPFAEAYSHFSPGEFELSLTTPPTGPHTFPAGYSVALRLPYLRLEETHAYFEFLGWLSRLAESDGFVGTLHTSGPHIAPTLLFVYGGEVYFDDYQGRPTPYHNQVANTAPHIGVSQ